MTWLLETSIKASLILTIGMVTTVVLRRRSAAVRHWVLATAIVCGAAVPIVGLVTPAWTIPMFRSRSPLADPVMTFSVNAGSAPATRTAPSPSRPAARQPLSQTRIADFVIPIWLAGMLFNLSILLFGMSRLARLGAPAAGRTDAWTESLHHVSGSLGVTRPVILVWSERLAVLVTWGALRPRILLPADAGDWSRERIDVVLAHELAHVARCDWLVQTIAEALKAVYWFNPLFWAACARLRHESEYACDDAVMNSGVNSVAYATHLLELARSFGRHRRTWLPAPAMAARPSNLERRVRAMLNVRVNRSPITRFSRWASALALVVVTLPIAAAAQEPFASLSGTVVDPMDRVVPNAAISVSDKARNVTHEVHTDANGRYELVGLPAGDYTMNVRLLGFRNVTDALSVNGQPVQRNLKLEVGTLQETITVTGQSGSGTSSQDVAARGVRRAIPPCPTGVVAGGNIRPPRKLHDVRPGYPGVDGTVSLAARIATDGTVSEVRVVKSDRPELEAAAIDAVRQWQFDETLLNCNAIEVQMNVDVTFRQGQ